MLDYMLITAFWYVNEWQLAIVYALMITGGLIDPAYKAYAIIFLWLLVLVKKLQKVER